MTTISDIEHQDMQVAAALRRLGRDPAGASCASHVVAGGLSGSVVLRVALAGEDMVLKLTPPGGNRSLTARARREAWFYRDLAARVPVRVPRVLGADVSETEGVALLLAAYAPALAPADWAERDYVEIAEELGRLHATFRGSPTAPGLPAWLRAGPTVTDAHCQKAAGLWRALGERDDLAEMLAPHLARLERHLPRIPALERRMPTTPVTLCHGDFHAGNLLRGPAGDWIWADWQETRVGPGVDDLAFFWQRAFTEVDTPPPYDALVDAYGEGLASAGEPVPDRAVLDRALQWSELRLWLVAWPEYLRFLSAARMERVLRRIDLLIGCLDLDRHP